MIKNPPKVLRHKAEMPLVSLAVVFIIVVIAFAIYAVSQHKHLTSIQQGIITVIAAGPIVALVNIRFSFWKAIADAVEVTENQFPDIYQIFMLTATDIGLDRLPRLFIYNGMGVLNAYSSKCSLKKKYIVIYSDIVDIYYEQNNADMLRFVLAHEMGHIYLGHVNVRRQILSNALRFVYFANTYIRAQEYSADRVAASVTPQGTRALALLPLFAGKHAYIKVSIEQYMANDVPGQSRFWMAVVNFMASHPVGKRRLATAYRMDHEDWRNVHGKML